jgi:hypothetical protein
LTKAQRADIALRGRQISLAERQAAMAGQQGAGGQRAAGRSGTTDKTKLATTLPSVLEAADTLNKMNPNDIKKLRPNVMDWAASAGTASGQLLGVPTGPALRELVARGFKPNAAELQYIQYANAIADAVARATDVGVLANFDIVRFRTQVAPTALDITNPEAAAFKFRQLKGWANWLANNRDMLQAADAAYESGKPLPDAQLVWKGAPPEASGVEVAAGEVMDTTAQDGRMAAPRAPSAAPAAIPGVAPLRTQVRPMGTQVRPASSAPSAVGGQSLEEQFPEQRDKIARARAAGFSDAQIRERLAGGR